VDTDADQQDDPKSDEQRIITDEEQELVQVC